MAQFARPDSTVTNTGNNNHTAVDEASPSDADYWYGDNNQADELEVGLSDVTDPSSSSGHTFRYRIAKTNAGTVDGGGNAVTVTARLMQGTTQIATDSAKTADGSWTQYAYTLSGGEADAITNYADLRLEFVTSASGGSPANRRGAAVSWAELEVPDAAAGVTGDGAISAPTGTVAGSGAEIFSGTGALSAPAATVEASGLEAFIGTGTIGVPAATVVGAGWGEITGTGALAGIAPTVVGSGAEAFIGTGAILVEPPLVLGTQSNDAEGTGAIAVAAPTVSGAGIEAMIASGAIALPVPVVAGAGIELFSATGAIVAATPDVTGVGWAEATGTGAIAAPAVQVQGSGSGGDAPAANPSVYRRHLLLSR